MRRDVLRVGIGRVALELALGAVLALPMGDLARALTVLAALASAIGLHLGLQRGQRRAFLAAHLAMLGAAIVAHAALAPACVIAGATLGGAIELTHVDFVQRRRLTEHLRSFRAPSSILVRRLGSAVVIVAGARASLALPGSLRPLGLVLLLASLGAIALLTAGFGAGPGRPVTRPNDALVFVALGVAMAVPA